MSLTKTILVNTWVVLFFVSIDRGVKELNSSIICSLLIFQGLESWKGNVEFRRHFSEFTNPAFSVIVIFGVSVFLEETFLRHLNTLKKKNVIKMKKMESGVSSHIAVLSVSL